MNFNDYQPLSVKVLDQQDLQVFSSAFQDALCPLVSMSLNNGVFSFLANRFCWELANNNRPSAEAVNSV